MAKYSAPCRYAAARVFGAVPRPWEGSGGRRSDRGEFREEKKNARRRNRLVGIKRCFAQDTERLVGGKRRAIRRKEPWRGSRGVGEVGKAEKKEWKGKGRREPAHRWYRGKETEQRKSIVRLLIEKWGRFMGYR